MTSAIPAEVMAGGVSINMVTKDAGNKWRGDTRYNFSTGCLDLAEPTARLPRERQLQTASIGTPARSSATRPRRPTTSTSPAAARWSRTGCGSTARSAAGSSTSWSTPRTPTARQAIDDNDAEELLGQGRVLDRRRTRRSRSRTTGTTRSAATAANAADHRARHRLAGPDQPGVVDAGEVHRHPQQAGVRVVVQRHGRADQLPLSARTRPPTAVRIVDTTLSTSPTNAAQRHEEISRTRAPVRQHGVDRASRAWAATTCSRAACSSGRLTYESRLRLC